MDRACCYSRRILRPKRILPRPLVAAVSLLVLAIGVCAGAVAVARTEAGEQDLDAALAPRGAADLRARVAAGAQVLVEVCVADVERAPLPAAVIVEGPSEGAPDGIVAVMTLGAVTLGAARRAGADACWTAYERIAPRAGVVSVRVADTDGAETLRVTAHLHVRAAPRRASWPALLCAFLGALGLAASLVMQRRARVADLSVVTRGRALGALLVGVVGAATVAVAVRHLGDASALFGLVRGLVLGAAEVGLALALAGWLAWRASLSMSDVLGAVPPRGGALSLLLTPAVSAICAVSAVLALRVLPSPQGEVPIEVFVSRPSGMFAFGLLAVVVPVCEELFFRGLVYGTARRALGGPWAFVLAAGLFLVAHAPQDWGSVGGLLSVALVALVTTALRAATGSVAVPMLAHLVYNALLTASTA